MARVITFSRTFPAYHPKAGKPTYFVEKILNGLTTMLFNFDAEPTPYWSNEFCESISNIQQSCKYHTIRAGNRWKAGMKFSPRVWSGKAYRSPQIILAPDITVEKVFDFSMDLNGVSVGLWVGWHYC